MFTRIYVLKKMLKIHFKVSIFGILMILVLIFGDNSKYAIIALSAAIIHEIGHIAASLLLKIKLDSFSLKLFKANIGVTLPLYSYKHELLLSLAGPIFNIISGIIAMYIYHRFYSNEYILFSIVASFFLAILNLLPIKGFDGGRIFICALAPHFNIYIAEYILEILSFSFILLLWIVSIYLMLKIGSSLTLFVFSSALFAEMFLNSENFQK